MVSNLTFAVDISQLYMANDEYGYWGRQVKVSLKRQASYGFLTSIYGGDKNI